MKKQYIVPITSTVPVSFVSMVAESTPIAGDGDVRDDGAPQLVREDEGIFGTQSW